MRLVCTVCFGVLLILTTVALLACGEQQSVLQPADPQSMMVGPRYCTDEDLEGTIYDPVWMDGDHWRAWCREPGGGKEWGDDGKKCEDIPGGCFPGDTVVIIGPKPYYNGSGAAPKGSDSNWSGAAEASGQYKGDIQMAIRAISRYDRQNTCEPIVRELLRRLNRGGIWTGQSSWRRGEWVNVEKEGGTIYVNRRPGFLWRADGSLISERVLRNTLAEEGIHMWFDTDIGHSGSDPDYKHDAMDTMRTKCGII
jgi:hypothetical protein